MTGTSRRQPTATHDLPELDRQLQGVFALLFPHDGSDLAGHVAKCLATVRDATPEQWNHWSAALSTVPGVYDAILKAGPPGLLALFQRWVEARSRFTDTLKKVAVSG